MKLTNALGLRRPVFAPADTNAGAVPASASGRSVSQGTWLAGFLLFVLAGFGGLLLAKGGLFIGKHEGDALHLLEIVFRMAEGQWPHLDFMTPIGVMAFAPISLFIELGFGVGHAVLYAQVLVGALLLPAVWWAGVSRLSGVLPFIFGFIVLMLAMALVHGEVQRSVSISMHYNRWAWAAAFVVIVLACLPPAERRNSLVDGLIIGLGLSFLALSKVTYFAAFFPPVALALLMRRDWQAVAVVAGTGLVCAGGVTLLAGPAFWMAYLGDILAVAGSEVRPQPGEPLAAVIAAPAYLAGSLLLLAGVVLLRQGKRADEGLLLLVLAPGFIYVTFQNFGNDPQWLLLLGVLLFAMRPGAGVTNGLGWDMRQSVSLVAAAVFALSAPSGFNLAFSPFRHLSVDAERYTPVLPQAGVHGDLLTVGLRAYRVDARMPMDGPGSGLEAYAARADRDALTVWNGETLPHCELELGMSAWFGAMTETLAAAGHSGKKIMAADLFSSFWLYGDFAPMEGGAPWYYGGLPGFESADLLVVPLCPIAPKVRAQILDSVEKSGAAMKEVGRTPLYILLEKG